MISGIDHIAIAVTSLEESVPFYRDVLGLRFEGYEAVPSQKVRVAVFEVGESKIELLEPTAADSPISKFLQTRGPGLHHLAFATSDLGQRLCDLAARDVALLDKEPRAGAQGKQIAFLHPKASGGVLMELCAAAQDGTSS